MIKPHSVSQTIDCYFKNWVIRPTIIFTDLNFKYNEGQFIFAKNNQYAIEPFKENRTDRHP